MMWSKTQKSGLTADLVYASLFSDCCFRIERRMKEVQFNWDEERRNAQTLQEQLDKNNARNKTMKRNMDELVQSCPFVALHTWLINVNIVL